MSISGKPLDEALRCTRRARSKMTEAIDGVYTELDMDNRREISLDIADEGGKHGTFYQLHTLRKLLNFVVEELVDVMAEVER